MLVPAAPLGSEVSNYLWAQTSRLDVNSLGQVNNLYRKRDVLLCQPCHPVRQVWVCFRAHDRDLLRCVALDESGSTLSHQLFAAIEWQARTYQVEYGPYKIIGVLVPLGHI